MYSHIWNQSNYWWAINSKSPLCFVECRNLSGCRNYYLFGTYALYIYIHTIVTADDSTIILFAVGLSVFADIVAWNPLRVVTVRIIFVISAIKNKKSFGYRRTNSYYNGVPISCFIFVFLNDFILAMILCARLGNNNYVYHPKINIILIFNFFVSGKNTNDLKKKKKYYNIVST